MYIYIYTYCRIGSLHWHGPPLSILLSKGNSTGPLVQHSKHQAPTGAHASFPNGVTEARSDVQGATLKPSTGVLSRNLVNGSKGVSTSENLGIQRIVRSSHIHLKFFRDMLQIHTPKNSIFYFSFQVNFTSTISSFDRGF